jgi:hypothetical protein
MCCTEFSVGQIVPSEDRMNIQLAETWKAATLT